MTRNWPFLISPGHISPRISFPALSLLLPPLCLFFTVVSLLAPPRFRVASLSLFYVLSIRRVSLNFPSRFCSSRFSFFRRHLLACPLSPFHFSIVGGKIIYLSAAFLLPSAVRCSYVPVLHWPETGDEDLLAAFHSFHERDSSRIVDLVRESRDYCGVFRHVCNTCKQQGEA